MVNSRFRFVFIRLAVLIMFGLLVFRLFNLQIVNGDRYNEITKSRMNVNMIEKAPRGQIYDRYGNPLVVNRAGYSLQLLKTDITEKEFNEMLLELRETIEETGDEFSDSLPISDYPFEFEFESEEAKSQWFSKNKYSKLLSPKMSADEVMEKYVYDIYNIPQNYTWDEARDVVGIRYEADLAGISTVSPIVIAEDISVELVTKIKERQDEFPGVTVINNYFREYKNGDYASHILGRIGKINAEEYQKYKDDGYSYNDVIGKQGIEKSAEGYLRGKDGVNGIQTDVDGKNFTLVPQQGAVGGNNVILTLDMQMQQVLEDSLAKNIKSINATGAGTEAGAAVVLDVKTGEVLACASHPTYNLGTFNEDYSELVENEAKPLWNRAISGTYTPGSTFKPLVAIAALQAGKVKPYETIYDKGVYEEYETYQPACWIWQENQATHGSLNVSAAIEHSCNYFFYEVGNRMGIDIIDEYASKFGFGQSTGIELTEEVSGSAANPGYKKKIVKDKYDSNWFAADTLQASIGQSIHAITPIQLANYVATIANGGTRYDVNIIKSIRSSVDNSIVMENSPTVVEKIDISDENLRAVREGMKNVVDEGSAHSIFSGYPIKIGGKTGTAQLGNDKANNAFFVAYAPYDDPEIAICVAIEQGVRGANAGYVARDLFDFYFKVDYKQVESANQAKKAEQEKKPEQQN